MYQRSFYIGATTCHLRLRRSPFRTDERAIWFGYPLIEEFAALDDSTPSSDNRMRGCFLRVVSSPDTLSLTTDLCGGFRLYFVRFGNEYWYSDDYSYLISIMRERGEIELDENEYEFWRRHRYTTGGRTYFAGLNKVPPGATISHDSGERRVLNLMLPALNKPSASAHTREVEEELRRTLRLIKSTRRQVLLSFSGGADSTLLALLCKDEQLDFTLLFFKAHPAYLENDRDYYRAEAVARQIGLPLSVVDTPFELDHDLGEQINDRMLFDRHVSLLHFGGMREAARRYGSKVIIVSGQGADSVLSFGPTQMTRGDFVARMLATYPLSPASALAAKIVSKKSGRELRKPHNLLEFMRSFLDQEYYYSLVKPGDSIADYLDDQVEQALTPGNHALSNLMRLKIHGFLQGSDNQVVIQSALAAGIDAVVMPFVSPAIINATVRHKHCPLDIIQPKYPVRRMLAKHRFSEPRMVARANTYHHTWKDLEQKVTEGLDQTRLALMRSQISVGVS